MGQLFTKENAAEMARRAVVAREARRVEARTAADKIPVDASDEARIARVKLQLERVDSMLLRCTMDAFPALTAAKERLWNLIFPKAGSFRPRSKEGRQSRPQVE